MNKFIIFSILLCINIIDARSAFPKIKINKQKCINYAINKSNIYILNNNTDNIIDKCICTHNNKCCNLVSYDTFIKNKNDCINNEYAIIGQGFTIAIAFWLIIALLVNLN